MGFPSRVPLRHGRHVHCIVVVRSVEAQQRNQLEWCNHDVDGNRDNESERLLLDSEVLFGGSECEGSEAMMRMMVVRL